MRNIDNYHPVIGLEVHVELKTKSKMFCSCKAEYFGEKPNTHVCPVCLGLPGALPVPNKKAIGWCVMIGLALNCKIPIFSKFDRKNYFYPDLPKGYQISQYDQPFAINGRIEIDSRRHLEGETNRHLQGEHKKRIRIRRVHMEEDTAKLVHQFRISNNKFPISNEKGISLIDFNRSGVPLVEIVTEPDFRSTNEVIEYLKKLQQIVRYLGVSDADMEKGEMRLEPNISLKSCHPEFISGSYSNTNGMPKQVRHDKTQLPNYKVEVKNINSFRFVEKAINYEIERQKKILESGKIPIQETRGWDSKKQITAAQRVKEETMDYRYFPEPDIPPIHWTKSQIQNIKSQIPELPDEKFARFRKEYFLSEYDAEILTREKGISDYFEDAVKVNKNLESQKETCTQIKTIVNWIINKKSDIEKTLPSQIIKNILESTKTEIIEEKELEKIINKIIIDNSKAISDYKKGKTAVIGFLIGQIKKTTKQPLDIQQVEKVIEKVLNLHFASC